MSDQPSDQPSGLRARLQAGETTFGTFLGAASIMTAQVCAAAGVDWVLLDLEHGSGGEETVRLIVPGAAAYGVPTVVRAESAELVRAGRLLDLGATGVMFPRLASVDDVATAVRHLRYPPGGDRGVATYTRQCRFGLDTSALGTSNDTALGVVQIETLGALDAVDEIAATDGVDVLFVGPFDLSYALGVPGDFGAPAYLDALDAVLAAAAEHGKAAGILVPDGTAAARVAAQGFRFVGVGSDTTLLAHALTAELRSARG